MGAIRARFLLCFWAIACLPTAALASSITYDITIQMTGPPYAGQTGYGQLTYDPALGPQLGLETLQLNIFGTELTLATTDGDPGAKYPVPNFNLPFGLEAGWGPVVPDSAGFNPGTSNQPAFEFAGPQLNYAPYGWIFLPGSSLCGACVIGISGNPDGSIYSGSVTYTAIAPVPEPASTLLVLIALLITPVLNCALRRHTDKLAKTHP